MTVNIIVGDTIERTPATFLRRVTGQNGAVITQAEIRYIYYDVWQVPMTRSRYQQLIGNIPVQGANLPPATDNSFPIAIAQDRPLLVTDIIFNTLQRDPIWTIDSIGYNFKATLPAEMFPLNPLENYPKILWQEVWFTLVPTVGEPFTLPFIVDKAFSLASRGGTASGSGTSL